MGVCIFFASFSEVDMDHPCFICLFLLACICVSGCVYTIDNCSDRGSAAKVPVLYVFAWLFMVCECLFLSVHVFAAAADSN